MASLPSRRHFTLLDHRSLVAITPGLPQNYMFAEMRRALDILDHIYSLPATTSPDGTSTPGSRDDAMAAIRAIEEDAMKDQTPQPGSSEVMDYLQGRGVRKALCTRNFE